MLRAQAYNYVQYGVNDQLASSTVYCMIQDKDRFMWFGTEAGLSRYDGTHFKTFTTADELPDNEILKMYEDSKGKIWMLPFKNSICYYKDGKFHHPGNDSVLKKLQFKERPLNVFEDKEGSIWVNESNMVHKIFRDGRVEQTTVLYGIKLGFTYLFACDNLNRIWFSVFEDSSYKIYKVENERAVAYATATKVASQNDFLFSACNRIWRSDPSTYSIVSDLYKNSGTLPTGTFLNTNTFSPVNDSTISINTGSGVRLFNVRTLQVGASLIERASVSCVLQDNERNWWVATLGEGVFRIQSDNFKKLEMGDRPSFKKRLSPVAIIDSFLYISPDDFRLAQIKLPGVKELRTISLDKRFPRCTIKEIIRQGNNYIILTNLGILKSDKNFQNMVEYEPSIYTKNVYRDNSDLYIATHQDVVRMDMNKFIITDTLWHGRSTAVYISKGIIYIATLQGLYTANPGKPIVYLGDKEPLLKSRISSLGESADSTLWIATTDNGLLRFDGQSILKHYNIANGLSSNICRSVFIDGQVVWVGTNNGLNRIDINDREKIISINRSDGLGSDLVDRVLVYGDTVFVGTSEGLTYFNKKLLNQFSECRLNLLAVSGISNIPAGDTLYTSSNKNLKIEYAGISYKSGRDIVYRYRLKGIDDEWKSTRETTLEFVSLPYGQYDLELVAENKFGVTSNRVIIRLSRRAPFWKTVLFYLVLGLVFIGVVLWLYKKRIIALETREAEKQVLNKKLVEMELKALRAQMNPHFTFNVLNSIQYFIGYNDTASAQNYLAKFAKLVRLTLDNSKTTFITLENELYMLKLYLDLEKMRFEDEFEYEIKLEKDIKPDKFLLPNMLIQPFVENAIKHGLKDNIKNGKVTIEIYSREDSFNCIITDNGIGRSMAKQFVGNTEHKPSGIAMVMDKVAALKHHYNYDMRVEIADMPGSINESMGTRVFISFPKKNIES